MFLLVLPLSFGSNTFVATETMPGWLQAFVKVNPVSHVVSAVRSLANEGTITSEVGWSVLALAIVVAIFAPLSVRSFKRKI